MQSSDLVTWPSHLIWLLDIADNLIWAFSQSHDFNSSQTATTFRPTTYIQYQTYDLCLWFKLILDITLLALYQQFYKQKA